ncbi:hypothetical protein [Amycolatopsis magusensis]|uniref:hypothetical protein n=1 Tax=Amycolatopsis magusensis TaxID=882444 RepID=UPI003C2EFCFB
MRLVRLAQQPSRVADDIRAALASLGRGNTVVGGVALIGVSPPGFTQPVDAVVLLPRGVLIVVGVDLPDPAMRLHAPLTGQWKADGWPLVGTEETVNPATEALATSEKIARHLRDTEPSTTTIGTIVAVGPYVEQVDQPPADLAGAVRVLHPTPTAMLAATVSLASASQPSTVVQARAMLAALAENAPALSDEVLAAEGFAPVILAEPERTEPVDSPLHVIPPTVPAEHPPAKAKIVRTPPRTPPVAVANVRRPGPPPPPPQARPPRQAPQRHPTQQVQPPRQQPQAPAKPAFQLPKLPKLPPLTKDGKPVRWLPFAAVGLLLVLLVSAVLVASNQDGSEAAAPEQGPSQTTTAAPTGQNVDGMGFSQVAAEGGTQCTPHAFGDTRTVLETTPCSRLRRASFEVSVDGRRAAVTLAALDFPNAEQAETFKQFVDFPGNGGITDLAVETQRWTGRPPTFSGAAYASTGAQSSVLIAQACWLDGPSTSDDPGLGRAAKAGLTMPLPG